MDEGGRGRRGVILTWNGEKNKDEHPETAFCNLVDLSRKSAVIVSTDTNRP